MKLLSTLFIALCGVASASAAATVAPYGIFEWQNKADNRPGLNHFTDTKITMKVVRRGTTDTISVGGFYDGRSRLKARYMPETPGDYDYVIISTDKNSDGKRGSFRCAGRPASHGPVRVKGIHGFAYADSLPYTPFGTTAYAWTHMAPGLRSLTLESLRKARFNKVRMCVMPKYYALCQKEPESYPFADGESAVPGMTLTAKDGRKFDLTHFNPDFFDKLEQCVDSLAAIGVEADLILFHPYDKGQWGFDSMPTEVNLRYVDYMVARFASRPNVWWSMANEYDYVKHRTLDQWIELIERVDSVDPSGHLLSIHGSTATYFPHHPALTHASIQDEAPVMEPGRAAILWSVYKMPVVMDEVCYEGNLASRWGRMSGEEMVHRIWNGLMGGIYVTHGECIRRHTEGTDTIMWAEGGTHRGESWKRIGFARDILSSMGGELRPADVSRDIRVSVSRPGHYLVYFGKEMPAEWEFDLPARCDNFAKLAPGTRLKAEIIDTWNLTVTPVDGEFVTAKADSYRLRDQKGRKIRLPLRPYMMIRLTPADGESIPLTFTFHDENEN